MLHFISHTYTWRKRTSGLSSLTDLEDLQQPSQKPREGTVEGRVNTKYFIQQRLIFQCHINVPLTPIKPYRTVQQQCATLKWWCCTAVPSVSQLRQ